MFPFFIRFTFGMKLYGKSDIVPGLFYVGTKCFHISGIPLFPYGSALVFENSRYVENSRSNAISLGNSVYKSVPFNLKSLLFLFARILLLAIFVADLVYLLAAGAPYFAPAAAASAPPPSVPNPAALLGAGLACLVSITLLYSSFRIALATKDQALSLAVVAGLPNELVLRNVAYKGYPLRNPKRQLRFHQCRKCGAINIIRLDLPGNGASACPSCKSPIAQLSQRRISLPIIIQVTFLLAIISAIVYFAIYTPARRTSSLAPHETNAPIKSSQPVRPVDPPK